MSSRRWDDDERGHGIADASASVGAISQLAELARTKDWVAEEPEVHLLPGLRERIAVSGLGLDSFAADRDGKFSVRLKTTMKLSRREIRQSVWSILGGVTELTTHVRETASEGLVAFEVVTGIPPDSGRFATHGHTLRIEVVQPD
ncbi:MAG TPA: hypothetical protein VEU76_10785 [Candidatus Udaeobacter sp.]|nr:hypothetical protein [Candidatus Udaeobacter sp.]